MVIKANDPIPLAIVQLFGNISWDDIIIGQDLIEQLITTYEAPDGVERKVMLGKRLNFILGTLYAQYCLDQPNAKPSSMWKASEYKKRECCI